jgi:hypothetical protein
MGLNPIRPRLRNISNDLAKVQINIAPGDEVEVSEDVAAQLAHQGAPMRPVGEPKKAPAKKAPAKKAAPKAGD